MAFNHDFGIQLPIIRNLKIILVTDPSLTPQIQLTLRVHKS